ncbi:MAG: DUF4956 domain-containing protein [Bacteroides sp.]|nr:DUF4956 domain-containing protein [Eubacterium sp.]MCM1418990.1 DUF4956 domain-containing protein [Roseburia sp.]MCM1463116.1 DUF4956 domain-containing protein [Bacteroides sp.]
MKIISIIDETLQLFSDALQFTALTPAGMIAAMLSALICGIIIFLVYRFCYRGVVYSDNFNVLLVMITAITGFIIMTISSNVVLSLGMVGALSIVRFRTAIKDPLDIGFLFWAIAAGLTAGAGLYFAAVFGTVAIAVIYIVFSLIKKQKRSYLLILRYGDGAEANVNAVLGGMKYRLKNKTKSEGVSELTVEVKVRNNDASSVSRFQEIEGVSSVTLLEYSGEYMN